MVNTVVQYLARDKLYETEKPYSAEFEIEEQTSTAKKTNYILSPQSVTIEAINPSDTFDLDIHGFRIINAKTELRVEDALSSPEMVEAAYLDEIKAVLQKHFPEYRRLEGMEFLVRKRDERFPSEELAIVSHEQPACLAHSDYSVDGAMLQLKASFPGQEDFYETAEFDIINVWRPLVGPNDDWPLALCDYSSIDSEHDIAVADLLHGNSQMTSWFFGMLIRPVDGRRRFIAPSSIHILEVLLDAAAKYASLDFGEGGWTSPYLNVANMEATGDLVYK